MNNASGSRLPAPWHFWLVSAVSLLWNGFGGYDYTMSKTAGIEYFRSMMPEPGQAEAMQQMLDSFPLLANIGWGLGVWGAVAGSVLLLLRSRHAFAAFVISLIGLAISSVYQWTMDMPAAFDTMQFKVMNLVIWVAVLFFVWYARHAAAKGWIR